ncbi:phospholipase D-like domain-containing protein [Bradyrhizobium sp. ISRA442]|uniref:phospholipase D-like domain-containing protein n=1 Tax=Bradyrhizobium sp. ISRA442 TaxID=2866197 RepID=UPI00311AEDAF
MSTKQAAANAIKKAKGKATGSGNGNVVVKAYTSPTLVLLAYDWPAGDEHEDFLGFAIERTPGFDGAAKSWLPNRIGFKGPKPDHSDFPSSEAPIQKFYWWDARIDTKDRGHSFKYRIVPVRGKPDALNLLDAQATAIDVQVPLTEEYGITTHFNRAVVSSQAFSKQFPEITTAAQQKAARAWLGNGMEQAVPQFLDRAAGKDIEGAIYHLTDETWIIPALKNYGGLISLAYNHTSKDQASDDAIQELEDSGRPADLFAARTHASIMHNKFLVRVGAADHPEAVLAGSANFTSEGLSAQANVLHAFESPELAKLYLARKRLLDGDPGLSETQKAQKGWSDEVVVGDATIRSFFPPEGNKTRVSIDTIIDAIKAAKHSILLCAFDPTDMNLLNAVFDASDEGKMMLALVNRVPAKEPTGDPSHGDVAAKIAILDRAQKSDEIVGFGAFSAKDTPTDFMPERVLWPGEDPKIMVRVHHKFVVIDAEGDNPVVFTGSANFSGNSLHHNDENMLEITKCPRIAGMYMAEFLRLYEHYRARVKSEDIKTFKLTPDYGWSRKYFKLGAPETKARMAMAGTAE